MYPESLRWLLVNGEYGRAEKLIQKILRFNNGQKEISTEMQSMLSEHRENREKQRLYNVCHLFRSRSLMIRSVILWYIWFCGSVGYFGLLFSTGSLPGFKYTTFMIGAGIEIVIFVLNIPILYFLGRRLPLATCIFIGGVACIACGIIQVGNAKTILALVGRCGLAAAFAIQILYTAEMYPTQIRSVGMGSCTFWTRVGGLLAPQINLLGAVTYSSLPVILYGVLAIVAAFLALLLPETLNKKLPDTVAEAETMGWGCCGRDNDYIPDGNEVIKRQDGIEL